MLEMQNEGCNGESRILALSPPITQLKSYTSQLPQYPLLKIKKLGLSHKFKCQFDKHLLNNTTHQVLCQGVGI